MREEDKAAAAEEEEEKEEEEEEEEEEFIQNRSRAGRDSSELAPSCKDSDSGCTKCVWLPV